MSQDTHGTGTGFGPPVRGAPMGGQQPGLSSSSQPQERVNPVATSTFLLNMAYPPPAVPYEAYRKRVEMCLQSPNAVLDEEIAREVIDKAKQRPFMLTPVILFVVQQALHSSKIARIACSVDLCQRLAVGMHCDFLQHLNKDMMKSFGSVIKTNDYKQRTIAGSIKKLENWFKGTSSTGGQAVDAHVHCLQRRTLWSIQEWVNMSSQYHSSCMPLHEYYNKLRRQGYNFPNEVVPTLGELMRAAGTQVTSYDNNVVFNPFKTAPPPPPDRVSTEDQFLSAEHVARLEKTIGILNRDYPNGIADMEEERGLKLNAIFSASMQKLQTQIVSLSENPTGHWQSEALLSKLLDLKDSIDHYSSEINTSLVASTKKKEHANDDYLDPFTEAQDDCLDPLISPMEGEKKALDPFAALDLLE